MVENLPADAGDTGSGPGLGGSHVLRRGWAPEPQLLGLRVWGLCCLTGEAAVVRGPRTAMEGGPRLPQLEKALAQKRRPNTAKKNKPKKKNKKKATRHRDGLVSGKVFCLFVCLFVLLSGLWRKLGCCIYERRKFCGVQKNLGVFSFETRAGEVKGSLTITSDP